MLYVTYLFNFVVLQHQDCISFTGEYYLAVYMFKILLNISSINGTALSLEMYTYCLSFVDLFTAEYDKFCLTCMLQIYGIEQNLK